MSDSFFFSLSGSSGGILGNCPGSIGGLSGESGRLNLTGYSGRTGTTGLAIVSRLFAVDGLGIGLSSILVVDGFATRSPGTTSAEILFVTAVFGSPARPVVSVTAARSFRTASRPVKRKSLPVRRIGSSFPLGTVTVCGPMRSAVRANTWRTGSVFPGSAPG